jgi:hypothetical protein
VWVRRSAIKRVPRFAQVPSSAVAAVQSALSKADSRARAREAFERLSSQQQPLALYLRQRFAQPLDAAALALGQRLAAAVYMAFDAACGARLGVVSDDGVASAEAWLAADEALRQSDPLDALDSEDVVAIEQPALVAFVNEQVGETLERHAGAIDVDHVAAVFRAILVEILALSHAVAPPPGHSTGHTQLA